MHFETYLPPAPLESYVASIFHFKHFYAGPFD